MTPKTKKAQTKKKTKNQTGAPNPGGNPPANPGRDTREDAGESRGPDDAGPDTRPSAPSGLTAGAISKNNDSSTTKGTSGAGSPPSPHVGPGVSAAVSVNATPPAPATPAVDEMGFEIDNRFLSASRLAGSSNRHKDRRSRPFKLLYTPADFDITQHPNLNVAGVREGTLWFLHQLILGTNKRKAEGATVPMSHDFLTKVINPSTLGKLTRTLITAGVIGNTGYVSPICSKVVNGAAVITKGRCREWWLINKSPIKRVAIDHQPTIKKMARLELDRKAMSNLGDDAVLAHLESNLKKATIDAAYVPVTVEIKSGPNVGEADNSDALKVQRFMADDKYISKDSYGRVHTNVTSLRGDCRKYLRINGQKLVSIDICNSQPLFLAALYKKQAENPDQEFIALCENGTLYDELMARAGATDRGAVKKALFANIFFGDLCHINYDSDVVIHFIAAFPGVWEFIQTKKALDYRALARSMQKVESKLMIAQVCGHLTQHHPEIPVLTVHDSILTTADHVAYVGALIKKQFDYLGLAVALKIENQ